MNHDRGLNVIVTADSGKINASLTQIEFDAAERRVITKTRKQRASPAKVREVGGNIGCGSAGHMADGVTVPDDIKGHIPRREHATARVHSVGSPTNQTPESRLCSNNDSELPPTLNP